VDPQVLELIKTVGGVLLSTGGALGLYLIFRKIDAEIQKALREDIAALRKENRDLRADLRKAEGRDGEEDST
jgi:cell division protein FtsB